MTLKGQIQNIFKKLFGFQKSITLHLSPDDLKYILSNYSHDDFELKKVEESSFKLLAINTLGTATFNNGGIESIHLSCQFKRMNDSIEFTFETEGSLLMAILNLGVIGTALFLLLSGVWEGIILLFFGLLSFFWFRWLLNHQRNMMVNHFEQDIKKYLYFKQKGYNYFSRKQ
jgi:hypothetical protein